MHKVPQTYQILIKGIVQGVGFRPFIWRLAHDFHFKGEVFNHTSGVTIILQDCDSHLDQFIERLKNSLPSACRIDQIEVHPIEATRNYLDFQITPSVSSWQRNVPISPDLHLCSDCLQELFDPHNRRYLYPFINCTNCGPRFSIITDLPYDRINTTMRNFQMCPECRAEYDNPLDRRFHAQPNACPVCGPQLTLSDGQTIIFQTSTHEANYRFFHEVAQLFQSGHIIALKSIGGYHLACAAHNEAAVQTLRNRKYRADKPFAVMFPSMSSLKEYCQVSEIDEELLTSVPHPIVLLPKRESKTLSKGIAPNNRFLGAMLPYTPLHALLFHIYPYPLVITSGNISDEPIAYEDEDAFRRLKGIADYFICHNRQIYIRCDDSVTRVFASQPYPIRLARGYQPQEIYLNQLFTKPILACGAEQKNTIALAQDNRIIVSQHIGDLKNYAAFTAFKHTIDHFCHIFEIKPAIIAYDLHPEYLSTKYALDANQAGLIKFGIQHHHAHAVSCMVDNDLQEPVLGIILDGTGYGTDGTLWGGEILKVTYQAIERIGHFAYVPMPGAQAAIEHPWQMALSYLYLLMGADAVNVELPFLNSIPQNQRLIIVKSLQNNFNAPITSSCGRLFDGVAALTGLCLHASYEGQPAVEFEQSIIEVDSRPYQLCLDTQSRPFQISYRRMLSEIIEDLKEGTPRGVIAWKFHQGLVEGLTAAAQYAREITAIDRVVLSGGVFMNMFILERLVSRLRQEGFTVYTHHRVPCNDGGIAVGQAVIANNQYQAKG